MLARTSFGYGSRHIKKSAQSARDPSHTTRKLSVRHKTLHQTPIASRRARKQDVIAGVLKIDRVCRNIHYDITGRAERRKCKSVTTNNLCQGNSAVLLGYLLFALLQLLHFTLPDFVESLRLRARGESSDISVSGIDCTDGDDCGKSSGDCSRRRLLSDLNLLSAYGRAANAAGGGDL